MQGTRSLWCRLMVVAVTVLLPQLASAKGQCTAGSPVEFRDALLDTVGCQSIKATDFVLTTDAVTKLFFLSQSQPTAGASADQTRRLQSMVFSGTKFQPGAISMFGDAVGLGVLKLRSLIFWNNGLDASPTESSEAVAALVQIMQSENAPRELRFTDNLLLDDGAVELCSAVAGSAVQTLVLSGNGIEPVGVELLCHELARAQNLTSLTITGAEGGKNGWMSNQVGEAGARGIRLLLESLKLERLVLSGSNLQDEGAAVVAGAINGNTFLKILDLNRNSISDVGAQAMADGLKQAHALQLLILSTNRISDTGAYGLALAARNNPNLNHIDVDHNGRITAKGTKALNIALTTKFAGARDEL